MKLTNFYSVLFVMSLSVFCFSCSDDDPLYTGFAECQVDELQVISDGKTCDLESSWFICEVLEIEETQYIDKDAYEWSPRICDLERGDQLTFKNAGTSTFFNVVEAIHYIAKERINLSCNENYEHSTYLCQRNEVINVSFLSDLLGPDTLRLELRTMTITYQDQTPGEKRNIINLWQDKSTSNVVNFWLRHFIGDGYHDRTWQSFQEETVLNGKVYKDVVKFEYGANIHADPDYRYYLQKGKGIIGFEVDDKLWLID